MATVEIRALSMRRKMSSIFALEMRSSLEQGTGIFLSSKKVTY
jgi:hypothetical protein